VYTHTHTHTHTHIYALACINREYIPQRENIGQRTIFLHDIYVNCLNVKEREEKEKEKDNMTDK